MEIYTCTSWTLWFAEARLLTLPSSVRRLWSNLTSFSSILAIWTGIIMLLYNVCICAKILAKRDVGGLLVQINALSSRIYTRVNGACVTWSRSFCGCLSAFVGDDVSLRVASLVASTSLRVLKIFFSIKTFAIMILDIARWRMASSSVVFWSI